MARGGKHRQGKIVGCDHHTIIEGLAKVLSALEPWEEIKTIRPVEVSITAPANRSRRRAAFNNHQGRRTGVRPGGGFTFRIKDWARMGETIVGVRCTASNGRLHQTVILISSDHEALWARLVKEGYCESKQ